MCSICGGTKFDSLAKYIWEKSMDRGRDYHNYEVLPIGPWIGNHRAIPTTELENPLENQPVGENVRIVFNGIISNDKELGIREGEADTSVLPRVLDFTNLKAFKESIEKKLIGSFAIAVMFDTGNIWLAANYKPIWFLEIDGQSYFSSLKHHFPGHTNPIRMEPYTVMDLRGGESHKIHRTQHNNSLVICSSGLDSTTVASYACYKHGPKNTTLIYFDYGCLATNNEKDRVIKISNYLGCHYKIQSMPSFGGSSLLQDDPSKIKQGIEGAEYAHEWVPARNLLMLSLTVAYAEANNIGHIYLGTNLEEAGAYPDNEEQFILDFNDLLYGAIQNGKKIDVHTPLGGLMKHEIIPFGRRYNTPYHLTWSCYKNENYHCGECGPCYMRKTAFERNGLKDPVIYENTGNSK